MKNDVKSIQIKSLQRCSEEWAADRFLKWCHSCFGTPWSASSSILPFVVFAEKHHRSIIHTIIAHRLQTFGKVLHIFRLCQFWKPPNLARKVEWTPNRTKPWKKNLSKSRLVIACKRSSSRAAANLKHGIGQCTASMKPLESISVYQAPSTPDVDERISFSLKKFLNVMKWFVWVQKDKRKV